MGYAVRIFLIFLLVFCDPFFLFASDHSFIPADGSTLLLIGQDNNTIDKYIEATKVVPAGFMAYTSIRYGEGIISDPIDWGAGINHPDYLLQKYPHTVLQIGLYMVGSLDETLHGDFDDNLKKLSLWFKKIKSPVYLRIGYEFDFPDNQYDPQKYIAAFRYVVDFLRKESVTNVAFVWHSYGVINPDKPISDWYPGDDYVDWVGVSFFEPKIDDLKTIAQYAHEKGKPLMIAEATPFRVGTLQGEKSWESWFPKLFTFIEEEHVRVLCYINCNWEKTLMFQGKGWGDARIEANDDVKEHWLKETGSARYLHASDDLFNKISYNSN